MNREELAATLAHAEAELDQSDPATAQPVPSAPTPTVRRATPPPPIARRVTRRILRPRPVPMPTPTGRAMEILRRAGYSDARISELMGC